MVAYDISPWDFLVKIGSWGANFVLHLECRAQSYLLCRWGCSSQRCICCWHSGLWGHITISLSSRFLTSRLEGRHWCSCSRWRSTGQKSCSFMKLLRQWKQYVWPQGVSMGLMRGCRQMWHTSSSSTSSWYSYRWFSGPSCCWPHSLQTRAHDRPAELLLLLETLVSVAAIGWRSLVQIPVSLWRILVLFASLKLKFGLSHEYQPVFPKENSTETMQHWSWVQAVISKVILVFCRKRNTVKLRQKPDYSYWDRPTPQEMTNLQSSSNMAALHSCFLSASFLRDKRNSHLSYESTCST